MAPQAMIGTGITIAMIGLLFLMLAWAQHMRELNEASVILLPVGAALLVLGAFAVLRAGTGKQR